MQDALAAARGQGGEVVTGGEPIEVGMGGHWVRPALVRMPAQEGVVLHETFAPILYALVYDDFDEALALHNAVPQGLSSGLFNNDVLEAEKYLGPEGADTGIANVNAGTSGAEDRRGVRRREGDGRRTRVGFGRLARRCAAQPTRSTTRARSSSPRASTSADRGSGWPRCDGAYARSFSGCGRLVLRVAEQVARLAVQDAAQRVQGGEADGLGARSSARTRWPG